MNKGLTKLYIGSILLLSLIFFSFYRIGLNNKQNKKSSEHITAKIKEQNITIWNRNAVDSAISLLRTGDLVMRRGIDVTSFMLSQANLKDKTYSHCGLVMMEKGYPFIYHSIGGEDNPDECLRRDSANFFFSPANNLSFGIARYDISQSGIVKLSGIVKQFYREHRKFDMNFDLKTDERLYCSEFVYKALKQATADSAYIKTVSLMGFPYVGIDDLFLNGHTKLVWQVKFK